MEYGVEKEQWEGPAAITCPGLQQTRQRCGGEEEKEQHWWRKRRRRRQRLWQ